MPRDDLLKGRVSLPGHAYHVTACTDSRLPLFRDFACGRLAVTDTIMPSAGKKIYATSRATSSPIRYARVWYSGLESTPCGTQSGCRGEFIRPDSGVAVSLNGVQRDMRHFQFVFSFGDVIDISGNAV